MADKLSNQQKVLTHNTTPCSLVRFIGRENPSPQLYRHMPILLPGRQLSFDGVLGGNVGPLL